MGFKLLTIVLGSGRVPHVRPSVHGLKKMGRSPFHCEKETDGWNPVVARPIGPHLFGMFFFTQPTKSASQGCRVTQRLWRGVEGPRRCLVYLCCRELFNHRARHVFPWAENQELAGILMSGGYVTPKCVSR